PVMVPAVEATSARGPGSSPSIRWGSTNHEITDTKRKSPSAATSGERARHSADRNPVTASGSCDLSDSNGRNAHGVSNSNPKTNSTLPRAAKGHLSSPVSHSAQISLANTSAAYNHNAHTRRF